jgi:hypothetical protein
MKKKTFRLLAIVILHSLACQSQVPTKEGERLTLVGGRYVFNETKSFTTAKEGFTASITKDGFIEIVSEDGDEIKYREVGGSSTEIHSMPKAQFFYSTDQRFQRYKGAEVGVYTVPFRLRGGGDDFDFEAALSLQANIVFGFGRKDSSKSWLDLSAGIGITSINLDEQNSNVTENRTASALTLNLGAVAKPAENANIGIFIGGDFLGKNDRQVDWVYNRNVWIGIGINISFNKIETGEGPSTK